MEIENSSTLADNLLTFPCPLEIKALGRKKSGFESQICTIIDRHLNGESILCTRSRSSRQGRYISVTCVIKAFDREQLNAIYLDLNREPDVLMVF